MRLGVLGLLGIWRRYKITLAISTILSIHVVLRTGSGVNRLRERRGGGRIRAIVCGGGIEGTIIVPEIQVKTISVGIHIGSITQLADGMDGGRREEGSRWERGEIQRSGGSGGVGGGEKSTTIFRPPQAGKGSD